MLALPGMALPSSLSRTFFTKASLAAVEGASSYLIGGGAGSAAGWQHPATTIVSANSSVRRRRGLGVLQTRLGFIGSLLGLALLAPGRRRCYSRSVRGG